VGKLAKLLMLDLATGNSRYGDVIAASAGHRKRDQVASSSRDEFTVLSFPGYVLIARFMSVPGVCSSVLSLLFCV